jgi:hypothetical protein
MLVLSFKFWSFKEPKPCSGLIEQTAKDSGVKTKICAAALIMSGGVMMVFAATKADPCAEKYKSCADSCANVQSQCKARGADPQQCENAYKMCVRDCDKAKGDCAGKAKKP